MQLAGDRTFHTRTYPPVPATKTAESTPFLHLTEDADDWDLQNQARMRELEQTQPNSQDLYDKFQAMREAERKQMEARNLVDSQDVRRSLDDAIVFVGSCPEMCPVYERVRREFQRNVKDLERSNGKISPQLAVKAFSRPAAGQPPALPSDVRPPSVLVKTLKYLLENTVPLLPESHPFLWDRTRSIRQDFTYQNYAGPEALLCTETICRIHVLCLHLMIGISDWSQQQELEQFNKSLRTLDEQYSLRPNRTLSDCPNEPEIHAYQLLVRMFDAETAYKVESLPKHVVENPLVQLALRIRALVRSTAGKPSQYYQFFKLVRDPATPLLFQIICEVHFPTIRTNLLYSVRKSLHKKNQSYNIDRLAQLMGFDSTQEAIAYLGNGVKIENNKLQLDSWDGKLEHVKASFIDARMDYSVLGNAPQLKPQQTAASQTSFFKAQPAAQPVKPALFGQSAPSQPAPAPVAPAFSASPASAAPTAPTAAASATPAPAPASATSAPIVPTPAPVPAKPAAPTQAEINAYVDKELTAVAKQLILQASQSAVQEVTRERLLRKQQHDQYLAGIEKKLADDILASIAREASILSTKAVLLRRKSLARAIVHPFKHRTASALSVITSRRKAENGIQEFISTLRNKSQPRKASPLAGLVFADPESQPEPQPKPSAPKPQSKPDTKLLTQAIATASQNGAKIIQVMADWSTSTGSSVKSLLELGPDYTRTTSSGVLITTDTLERPDIVLNFLDHHMVGYIGTHPPESFIERIASQISQFRPALPPPKQQDVSANDTTEVSLFLPSKRSFSSWSEWTSEGNISEPLFPPKRVSMPKPHINRALSGVHELQKLLQESKKLIN